MGKLEDLGAEAQELAVKLKAQGLSHNAITNEINLQFGSDLETHNIKEFLKRKTENIFQIAREDKNFNKKMSERYWNTADQLLNLNSDIAELFYKIRDDPDYRLVKTTCPHCRKPHELHLKNYQTMLKAADVLLRQIKHVDDTIRKVQENNFNININMVDATQKIIRIMPQIFELAERRGIIKKWNKSKLKEFQEAK